MNSENDKKTASSGSQPDQKASEIKYLTAPLPDLADGATRELKFLTAPLPDASAAQTDIFADTSALELGDLHEEPDGMQREPAPEIQNAVQPEPAAAEKAAQTLFNSEELEEPAPAMVVNRKNNGKKKKTILWVLLGIVAVLAGIYIWGIVHYKTVFLPKTYVSGYDVANKTEAEVKEILTNSTADRSITVLGKDGQSGSISAADIDLKLSSSPDVVKTLKAQNLWAWPLAFIKSDHLNLESDYTYDETKLKNAVAALGIVSGTQVVKTANAKAVYDGTKFNIQDEVYGTEVDQTKLADAALKALLNGESQLDLDKAGLYVQPTIKKDNATLTSAVSKMNTALGTVVTYTFGSATEKLDKNTFAAWLSTDDKGEAVVDTAAAKAYAKTLAAKYDTVDTDIPFNTSTGASITISSPYFGWEIDTGAEAEALKTILLEGKAVTREPEYYQRGVDRNLGNTIGNTYLEISIGAQTMWYYKNGQLIQSTPVVTGDVAGGYSTPTGLYKLQYKAEDVALSGQNADGSDYNSPVNFWMPFNGDIGVHDASWRSQYGGTIYQTGGSHGCVNTPYAAAQVIYNNISDGDPVVVY